MVWSSILCEVPCTTMVFFHHHCHILIIFRKIRKPSFFKKKSILHVVGNVSLQHCSLRDLFLLGRESAHTQKHSSSNANVLLTKHGNRNYKQPINNHRATILSHCHKSPKETVPFLLLFFCWRRQGNLPICQGWLSR